MRGGISEHAVVKVGSLEVEDLTILGRILEHLQSGKKTVTLEFNSKEDRSSFTGGFVKSDKRPTAGTGAYELEQALAAHGYRITGRDYGTYYITHNIDISKTHQ